jgi:hypothetical protein
MKNTNKYKVGRTYTNPDTGKTQYLFYNGTGDVSTWTTSVYIAITMPYDIALRIANTYGGELLEA